MSVHANEDKLSSLATISHADLVGDCAGDQIAIIDEFGEHFLVAYFNNMSAIAKDRIEDKKRCIMNFNVNFVPGNELNVFQFFVDGSYQLSPQGGARLLISHRMANHASVEANKSFKAGIEPQSGDIHEILGDISKDDIPLLYGRCGATIPLKTTIFLEAVKPSAGENEFTKISLEKGPFRNYIKLGKIIASPCER
jgi:hypothetical protein